MLRPGHVVLLCAVALITLGVVMVNSASMQVRPLDPGADPAVAAAASGITLTSVLTSRTAFYMLAAIAAMIVCSQIPVARLADRLVPQPTTSLVPTGRPARADLLFLGVATLVLLVITALVYVPGIARPVNGAHRWVDLGLPGLNSFQPSELAKWGVIPLVALYAARLARREGEPLTRFFTGLVPPLVAVGLLAALVIVEDLGTGFLIAAVGAFVLLAAGARARHFALFVPVAVAGVTYAIMTSPYRVRRILAFLDPYADPEGSGFHMIQSMSTVAGAGPFGRGLGHGLQKFGYLPEDTTDFLFAIICEELGLAGATLVIALYLIMLWASIHIARREQRPLLKLLVLGVAATIAIQAAINLVVVTGLGPTKGIALPLLSSGGTGWILTSAMLGLVAATDRTLASTTQANIHAAEHTPDIAAPAKPRVRLSLEREPDPQPA